MNCTMALFFSLILALSAPMGVGAGWACTVNAPRDTNVVVLGMAGRATGAWHQQGSVVEFGADWAWDPHQLMPKGYSTISISFTVPFSSEYVINMQTEARHQTEYNDLWLRVKNLSLWKRPMYNLNHRYGAGNRWLKVYQNSGSWSNGVYTTDHNPMAITGWFEAGRTYQVELSGRSTHFRVRNIVLVACNGAECSPKSETSNGVFRRGITPSTCS